MKVRKMIKNHMVTCSVMVVLMIISVEGFCSKVRRKAARVHHAVPPLIAPIEEPVATLSFADESVPTDDGRVMSKLNHSLKHHSFKTLHTLALHRKAEKWFPIIEPILKAYNIPDDFKYVPLVESGLGDGKSPKGAYGPWQFMPSTARDYGLKVNSHVDERRNIRKATIAACKYLRGLHRQFHSWTLTAAAYNLGSPMLSSAMHRQKLNNYFKMKLNRETGWYVYNIVAMKEIINNPANYGYNYHKPQYGISSKFNNDLLAVAP